MLNRLTNSCLLSGTIFFVVLLVPQAQASQWATAAAQRTELSAYVDNFETLVTVVAEIDDRQNSTELDRVVVTYSDERIVIPKNILRAAPRPILETMSLLYCGRARLTLLDSDGSTEPLTLSKHPCLAVQIEFQNPHIFSDGRVEYPYMTVEIYDGKISGYSITSFDGKEWRTESF